MKLRLTFEDIDELLGGPSGQRITRGIVEVVGDHKLRLPPPPADLVFEKPHPIVEAAFRRATVVAETEET